ncbi:hypothetical protein CDAR_454941 [Caerostris darwini]|uniref:Uncharacterized protein n=1 Tax=Caerostris darwini TaxID=1538125 RepID=A0AAV4R3V7_9ARAC|nr:hypothetical protein CDAR_454941 [Caerostris darwini]
MNAIRIQKNNNSGQRELQKLKSQSSCFCSTAVDGRRDAFSCKIKGHHKRQIHHAVCGIKRNTNARFIKVNTSGRPSSSIIERSFLILCGDRTSGTMFVHRGVLNRLGLRILLKIIQFLY